MTTIVFFISASVAVAGVALLSVPAALITAGAVGCLFAGGLAYHAPSPDGDR